MNPVISGPMPYTLARDIDKWIIKMQLLYSPKTYQRLWNIRILNSNSPNPEHEYLTGAHSLRSTNTQIVFLRSKLQKTAVLYVDEMFWNDLAKVSIMYLRNLFDLSNQIWILKGQYGFSHTFAVRSLFVRTRKLMIGKINLFSIPKMESKMVLRPLRKNHSNLKPRHLRSGAERASAGRVSEVWPSEYGTLGRSAVRQGRREQRTTAQEQNRFFTSICTEQPIDGRLTTA